jgi:hypothetical protein
MRGVKPAMMRLRGEMFGLRFCAHLDLADDRAFSNALGVEASIFRRVDSSTAPAIKVIVLVFNAPHGALC